MPDDTYKDLLSEYRNRLHEYSQQINVDNSPAPDDSSLAPLLSRVKKLIDSIPLPEQKQGLSLSELQIRLRGRKGKKCHPGELADCLRKLGYERRRGWREGRAGFCSRWYKHF